MATKKGKYKSSFGVLRSNPRISGNLKISVDSSGNLWFNSIDSNDEMSKNQYKGYRISPDGDFAQDVYNFFDEGKTPGDFVFGLKNEKSPKDTYTSTLSDQFDGFYHAGANPLISNLYEEEFSFLAPIRVQRDLPKYFVIFRITDPIDFSYLIPVTSLTVGKTYKVVEKYGLDKNSNSYLPYKIKSSGTEYSSGEIFVASSTGFDLVQGQGDVILLDSNYNIQFIGDEQDHFIENILPKSRIVATYSLQEDSKLGKYLSKIRSNINYTQSLIDVKFEKDSLTTYNGVSIKDGVFCKKGEYLNSVFSADAPIIETDELITDGFKRNGVISHSILNLEFLFNDPDADLYSINRYYGFYVDDIKTGTFRLSADLFFNNSASVNNFPEPKSPYQISDKMTSSYYQQNDNGLRLFVDPDSIWGYVPTSDDVHTNERLKSFYIKDKNRNFYSYKQIKNYSTDATNSDKWGTGTTQNDLLIISNKLVDLSVFSGPNSLKTKEYKGEISEETGRSYSVIKIDGQLLPNDAIVLYHPFGVNQIGNRRFDYFVASELTYVRGGWGPGSFTDEGGVYYFHPFGTKSQIAEAIAGVLNSVNYKSYRAFAIGNEVIIRTSGSDETNNNLFSLFSYRDYYNKLSFDRRGKIFFNDIDVNDLTTDLKFIGGSKYSNTRIKIKNEDAYKLSVDRSYIKTNFGLSKVKFIGKCVDYSDSELQYNTIKDYLTHSIVEIQDNTHTVLRGSLGTIITEELVDIETGVFSFYPTKDLDVDFWSSTYGKTPTEEYYRYIDVQPDGITPIYEGIDYAVANGSTVSYMGSTYGPTGSYIFRGGTASNYSLISGNNSGKANVVPLMYVKDLNQARFFGFNDPLPDLDRFPGFAGLQEIKYLDEASQISSKRDQMNFGKVDNEYDVLKENYLRSLVTRSRVTPYITKWVYEGGTDVRGNDYRLNSSSAFTPLNFSPGFFSPGRDPLYFTNEWYVLETPPISATSNLIKSSSNYCAGSFSLSSVQNADPASEDYFLNYFTVDGKDFYDLDNVRFSSVESKPIEQRYTWFTYDNSSGFSETLYRGVKVRIKERTEASIQTRETNLFKTGDQKFNDYKFSCILRAVEDPDPYGVTSPVTFQVHQNEEFKTVTFIITLIVSDVRFVDPEKLKDILYLASGPADVSQSNSTGSWYFNPTGIHGGADYFGLYSLSNKLRHKVTGGSGTDEYSRITSSPAGLLNSDLSYVKLSSGLNFSSLATIGIQSIVSSTTVDGTGIAAIATNPNYDTDLRNEVQFYSPTTPVNSFSPGSRPANYLDTFTLFSPKSGDPGAYWYRTPWITGAGKNYVNFSEISYVGGYYFDFSNLGYTPPSFTSVPVPVSYNIFSARAVYQAGAGQSYWDSVFDKITFPEIYKLFLNNSPYIKYTKSYWNTTTQSTVVTSDTFVLEFIKPSSFLQTNKLIPVEENYKPESFSNVNVGYDLVSEDDVTEFFRYGGGYTPKFLEIIHFKNTKNDFLVSDRDTPTSPSLQIDVSISEKIPGSPYYGVGSSYEISIDGKTRKKIRLVRGNTYNFVFTNFVKDSVPSYSGSSTYSENSVVDYLGNLYISLANSNTGNTPTSSPLWWTSYSVVARKDFVLSILKNSGESADVYSKGFTYSGVTGATFIVPQNAPDEIYYELKDESYSGGSSLIAESLEYKNVTFGSNKDNFGKVKNVNFYKYAKSNPFQVDPQSGYKAEYPLIGESPIGIRDTFIFESTWDPGRYREYSTGNSFNYIPGTKNMIEQKNFFGSKVMKTPNTIREDFQLKYSSSISDVFSVNKDLYPKYEILWEETETEIKALLIVERTAIKHFQEGGIDKKFSEILVPEFGIGDGTILSDDIDEYLKNNVLPQYETKEIVVYIKKIRRTEGVDLDPIITNLSNYEKISSGFVKTNNNDIKKRSQLEFEYRLQKDPTYDYSVAFSLLVGKI